MEERQVQYRQLYLGALLVLAAAVAHGIGDGRELRWIRPLWNFVQLAAIPGLVFLFGSVSRVLMDTRERLIRYAMACGELYLLQKLLIYWVRVAMGRAPNFHIFSSANAPWLYFVFGEYLLLMLLAEGRQWKRNLVFGISVAAGCLCGLAGWIGDEFCLSRMLVFLPFFLAGRWGDRERLDRFLSRRYVRLGGLVFVLGTLLVCFKKAKFLYKISAFTDGNQPFSVLPPSLLARMGPLSRLAWYAAIACLVLALLALMPRRRLWRFPELCAGWPLAYLWQRPVTTVFASLIMKQLVARMGNKGYLPGTLVMILVLLVTFLPWALRPLRALVRRADFWHAPAKEERLADTEGKRRLRLSVGAKSALIFTGVFFVLATALTLPLFDDGRSMVWRVDGLRQIYPGMVFLRGYLRGMLKTFLTTGALRLNQFTFQAGMGMGVLDVIRRDPVSLLCVLAPAGHMEAAYAALSLIRIWLAGLAFIWLCRELEREDTLAIVLGAISFAFCGYSLYVMIRQPGLQTPWLIYFPLMLAGVERFLRKRKGGLFLAMVCLSFVVGYYLAYMNTLLMALYLLVRLIDIHGKDVRSIVTEIGKMIGIYFWGMALAAVTLLPTFYSYLTCSRRGEIGRHTSLLFYDWEYYERLFTELAKGVPNYGQKWSIVSFAGLTLLAMVLLFLRKERQLRALKAGVILCTVMVCMPLFGRIMNGFGYVSNRWTYGFALVGALTLVYMLPAFLTLTRREKIILLTVAGLYLGLALTRDDLLRGAWYTGLLLLALTLLAVLTLDLIAADERQKRTVLALTMGLTMLVSVTATFHPQAGDYAGECLDAGEVQNKLESSPVRAVSALPREGFYRVEQPGRSYNQSMAMNFYGTSAYFSVLPGQMSELYMDLNMNTVTQSFDLRGFDERASLLALASVGYYLTDQARVPFGFTQIGEEDGVRIYRNNYALPLGCTYTSCVSESAYERMDFAQKQQLLLQHAVVPNGKMPDELDKGMARLTAQRRSCRIVATQDVKLDTEKKLLRVKEDGGSVTIRYDALPDSETYLYLNGINYADPESESVSTLEVEADGMVSRACLRGRQQNYYYSHKGIAFNLGYDKKGGVKTCTLTFDEAGDFSYSAFRAVSLPMADFVSDVEARRAVALEKVKEDGDRISGEITLPDHRLLALSIPYSKGWTLRVDGEKTPLMEVNRMYLGAVLEPGTHKIELRYTMPWFRGGAVISGLALLALLGRGAWGLARRRSAQTEERQEDDAHDPL